MLSVIAVRCAEARILTLRGQAAQAAGWLDWLESTARETGSVIFTVVGLGTAALARAGLGQNDAAATLLAQVEATPGAHDLNYYSLLPSMVRTALRIGDQQLAEQLAGRVEPRYPIAEHALVAANAALAEARGDLQAAAHAYADAADRWQNFGFVPEQAFALLGQGRCLTALGRITEASPVLQQAREIFQTLQAAPALAETDQLLEQATALSS